MSSLREHEMRKIAVEGEPRETQMATLTASCSDYGIESSPTRSARFPLANIEVLLAKRGNTRRGFRWIVHSEKDSMELRMVVSLSAVRLSVKEASCFCHIVILFDLVDKQFPEV